MLVILTGIFAQQVLGQVSDNFSDGDLTANPAWSGSATHFTVNALRQLQLNDAAAGTSHLSVPFSFTAAKNVQWEFYIKQTFAGSAGNFSRVYLVSSQQDLASPLNGYYLQFGEAGANDAVELFRQTGSASVSVCRATLGQIANSVNARIRATRSHSGAWNIMADYAGGTNFVLEATGQDNTHTTSTSFFGIRCTYTATNATRFFYDDFAVVSSNSFPDISPPEVSAVQVYSSMAVDLQFSEPLDLSTAQDKQNYSLSAENIHPVSCVLQSDQQTVKLLFNTPFSNGHTQVLSVKNIKDVAGNTIVSTSTSFTFFQPVPANKKDLLITEIMADPAPPVGLPEAEFLEIYNRSAEPFDLSGWQITDGTTTGRLSSQILLPGEYLILSSMAALSSFSGFGKVMGVSSFPSLNNASDVIRLKDQQGKTIDSVSYSAIWYRNDNKNDGGWTLELIDPDDLCKGSENWTASTHESGGTPGRQNAVFANTPDVTGPRLLSVTAVAPDKVTLTFDEKLNTAVPAVNSFVMEPSKEVLSVSFTDDTFTAVGLLLATALDFSTTYTVAVQNIADCPGNMIQPEHSTVLLKLDAVRPLVDSMKVISANELTVTFSERLKASSAQDITNFQTPVPGSITSATLLADQLTVKLLFSQPFVNGSENTIVIKDVADLAGNTMLATEKKFTFFQPARASHKDIVISEIFADPTPQIGLPESEFVEIFNRSEKPFDLKGWKLSDGNTEAVLTSFILLPHQYLILCAGAKATQFSSFGNTMGTKVFPSLNNSGDALVLRDAGGMPVDSVNYTITWYGDDEKKDGGWTLELIDPDDLCKGSENWTASMHESGGTPGRQNAVFANTPDVSGPKLLSIAAVDPDKVTLIFNEKLNAAVPATNSFVIAPAKEILSVSFTDNTFTGIDLLLAVALDFSQTYHVSVQNIFDCPGNIIQPEHSTVLLNPDAVSPLVDSVKVISANELTITFSEKLKASSAQEITNFLTADAATIISATLLADQLTVKLLFSQPFINGQENTITIKDITDLAGNSMIATEKKFVFFQPTEAAYKDIVITEIFADPAPQIGLPESEFVEIFNRSEMAFDLKAWKLSDGNTEAVLTGVILLPHQYLILCPGAKATQFSSFGNTMGTKVFPSLNNTGDALVLKDAGGMTIDSVNYTIAWYKDDEKKDGGWTLELIDPENHCAGSGNWIASEDERGGTPGRQNSVFANKPDLTGPKLVSVFPVSEKVLLLQFDEKLAKNLPSADHFSVAPQHRFLEVSFASPALTSLHLTLDEKLRRGVEYQLAAEDVYDCAGNILQAEFNHATFAMPEKADGADVIVNEILFNPRPAGVDFVEIMNRSAKFINLKNWKLGNLAAGALANAKPFFADNFLLKPYAYIVLTENGNTLKGEYLRAREETFIEADLPSFPDDEGSVVLADDEGTIIDAFSYTDKMHSVFLNKEEGVSLERIGFWQATNDLQNWKSASADAGFATPGYLNSNARAEGIAGEAISVEPEIFVPLNGQPDFTQIKYNFDRGGFIANIKIFDAQGREVKQLANNELLGTEGFFRWDGDLNNGTKARIGAYMIWVEVFDSGGMVKTFRKRIIVAGEF